MEISRTNLTPEEIEKTKIDIMEFPLPQEEKREYRFLIIGDILKVVEKQKVMVKSRFHQVK
ncbi:MAG TPA: hypothetical protein P5065_06575 [Candidatus Ratteibacteria bacterium]|nr:hypothetical protein [bacterium]HRS06688.1 hypothetical protein [Candidatus Ratteibacteria bacterium]HRV04814.1 hypothetical protein [Candidatus Ratteibacteria bacterium]